MRLALCLLLTASVSPPAAAIASMPTAPSFAAFDESIADTKQAMMGDPEHALDSANAAVQLARRLPPSHRAKVAVVTAEWLHGEALIFLNRASDAQAIVGKALRDVERFAPNSKLHGDLLRSDGAIAAGAGRILEALHDYQRAHEVFRKAGEKRSQAIALQDIGLIYWDAGDYTRALDYYQQSAEVFNGDPTLSMTMHNNRAEVFRKQKRFAQAAVAYRAALVEARKLDSPLLQTRILTNLAGSEAEAGRLSSAQTAINQAIVLSRHGEGAGWQPFVYGVAARIALESRELDRAEALIERTFRGVDFDQTEMLFREYHATAAQIYERTDKPALALAHIKAFQRLDNEAQALTASTAAQLLSARFDFANQNLKISNLKQGQLQRDIQIERQRGRFRTTLLGALLAGGGIVFGLLLVGFFSLRRSRNKVRDANTNLSQVNGALEKALKVKTEFLATTSHEIRTPLNGILGMTQVLLADARVHDDIRERIEVVHGAGETMRALVDDILDVAKMESGNLTVVEEPTNILAILHDAARLWRGHADAKGLKLLLKIDGVPEQILSDGTRLRQIVFNLMSNAMKFTSAGSVTLEARGERDGDGDERLQISVCDTGIGIARDQQGQIFEAFRQVDGGTTRKFGGTGLGLAICRNLAEALGGAIDVVSMMGRGATFTVRIPLRRVEASADCGETAQAAALNDASILIVGGDQFSQGPLRMLLAAEGAATEASPSVDEAAHAISSNAFNHVIADVETLTVNDDIKDALRQLIACADKHTAKVSLLLTHASALTVADAMMVGACQIILKPVTGDVLVAALASLHGPNPETLIAPSLFATEAA